MTSTHPSAGPSPATGTDRTQRDAPQFLGPAHVTGGTKTRPLVELDDGDATAVTVTMALTFPYEPTPGDVLLVVGQPNGYYAVGVITASRPADLRFPGPVSIHAGGGRLTLSSDRAVELEAPRITMRAGVLRTVAGSMIEKTDRLRRWVRGLLAIRAGSSRRVVDGEDSTRCQNSTTLAKDTVTIDGDQLHLGH